MAKPSGILFLDISLQTGWAYGHPADDRPVWGVWQLEKRFGLGATLVSLENEISDAILLHKPSRIVAEALMPMNQGIKKSAATWRLQISMAGVAEAEAYRGGVEFRDAKVDTIRAAVLGTSRFGGRDECKRAVLVYCRKMRNWMVPDDNAGDACVGWEYCRMKHAEAEMLRRAR